MAENVEFNVRLCQIKKTHAEWLNVTTPLEEGELVITSGAHPDNAGVNILVAVIGDGTSTYSQLFESQKFLSAPASDVYAWAKSSKKPEYLSDEIKVGQPEDQNYADWYGKTMTEALADLLSMIERTDENVAIGAEYTLKLIGGDTGKSVRDIAADEIAKQLIPENAEESLDALQEISAWIQKHPGDASEMNLAIETLNAMLVGIEEFDTVADYVDAAIDALKIGDYAKAADLTALAARISTLESQAHTHSNRNVLDSITEEKVAAWNAGLNGADLSQLAKTGSTDDLVQGEKTIILRCVI